MQVERSPVGQISHDLTHAQLVEALDLAKAAIEDLDGRGCDVLGISAAIESEMRRRVQAVPVITIRANKAAAALGGAKTGMFAMDGHILVCRVAHHMGCLVKWSAIRLHGQEAGHA